MLEDLTTAAPPASWPAAYPQGYAVVDVETTGLARDDRIISAAVYRLDARGEVEDHWYTMVNPERDPGPVWIHGLTSDVLEGAPLFQDIAEDFAAHLADRVLVAHNAVFDWSMIAREYARAEREAPVRQRLCTIALSKELELPLPNHKLESLAAHFGVVQRRAHHALDDARVLAEAFRPSLRAAMSKGVRLPLLECRPLKEWSDSAATPRIGRQAGAYSSGSGYPSGSWRPSRKRPACPYPNPGRYEEGKPLKQGMRVAFSGDTSVDRELLEDRAVEAGLHVATSLSRLTSLLVTNDPDSGTSKAVRARQFGTPVIDEAAFGQLLRDVEPASGA
ncbi:MULTISPECIES: DEDDh family exonuclease [Streptomyces]|uniref:DNA polymerase III subunit epsilon n=1 Tax=Streptomyces dengpaensis TaxID=2049881 RepID=A0ABM6SY07_9ACTN|nr:MULTISPECIES: DEDDh family exonuclease [Streptomyces]AVH59489.1 DNA polymerase III subunit epsilon [Streptomyces dengpaensis]PIB05846.1 DNA polymerase III subunit epsilon [Streptomyces sp. HG99]